MPGEYQVCPKCDQMRPPTDFAMRPRKYPWCLACRYARHLVYHREASRRRTAKLRADPATWRAEQARRREAATLYRSVSGDRYREYQRLYHRAYDRTYRKEPADTTRD